MLLTVFCTWDGLEIKVARHEPDCLQALQLQPSLHSDLFNTNQQQQNQLL
jgi:hypothetical protein